jgi:hypothetical protein
MSSVTWPEAGKSSVNTEEAARGAREDGRPTEARKYIWHTEQNMGLQTVAGKPPSVYLHIQMPKNVQEEQYIYGNVYSNACFI